MENDSRNQEVNKAPISQTADIVPDNAPACEKDVVVRPPAASPGNGAGNRAAQFPETEETKKLKENYGFFGISAFIYAVFYTFCMFRNGSGVTFPIFVAGSLFLLTLSLSKLGMALKRGSIYYMVSMFLLGISTFLTDDWRIIFYNKLGVFLLMISLLLKQFFDT